MSFCDEGWGHGGPCASHSSKSLDLLCFLRTMTLSSSPLSHGLSGQLWVLWLGYIVETLALNARALLREWEAGRELLWGRAPLFGLLLFLKQGGLDESGKEGDVGDFNLPGSP